MMKKDELVAALADNAGTTKANANLILSAMADVIAASMQDGKTVTIPGLCKFTVRDRKERMVRNPATGASRVKAAGKSAKVALLKSMKDRVNS